jgi:glycosyltransferase involved in cell wall biosynthesis
MLENALKQDASKNLPLVSVIVPFYKQEAYLPDTAKSILGDGYSRTEIIVVDDGSPVPAASVLPTDLRLKIIRTENCGLSAARNRGFRESSGEFLLFLDSDDRLVPGAIASHLTLLLQQSGAVLSFGAVSTIDQHGTQLAPPHVCRPRSDYFFKLLEGNMIATPGAALIRRNAFEQVGLFDESFRMVEDYRLYLQLAKRHRFVLNERHVLERRMHGSNMSRNLEPMLAATMTALDKLEAEETLSERERKQIAYGRRRWVHAYRPKDNLRYRLRSFYYSLRSMLGVSPFQVLRHRTYRS